MRTMRPVCTNCQVFMKCAKNGYVVGFKLGRRYDSDRFECQECGASIALLAQTFHKEPPHNGKPVTADIIVKE